jgi:hypothetical protein
MGYPEDAQHHTFLGHSRNVFDLALLGCAQVYFADLGDFHRRVRRVLSSFWFIVVFMMSGPVYSFISGISAIDQAVTEDSDFASAFILTMGLVASLVLGILGWHVILAKRAFRNRSEFKFYIGLRAVLYIAFMLAYLIIRSEANDRGPAKLHLHHYFVAWVLSLVACFNDPVSQVFLAITSGIFVQGISVYSSASMFYRGQDDRACPEIFIS